MQVQSYLNFDGRCEEALEFYKKAVGAKVERIMRFKESPDQTNVTPGTEDKIMHSSLLIGETPLMASDGHCGGKPGFAGISLTLTVDSESDAEQRFAALSEGGQVTMPLTKTFFSPRFGMLTDRFGVSWMLLVRMQGA